MKRVQFAPAALLVLAAACSSTPQPTVEPTPQPTVSTPAPTAARPAAFSPIGQFDFTTMAQGEQVNGMIEIVRLDNGAMGGKLTTTATPDLPIKSVTVDGRKVTIESEIPDAGPLVITLNFEADNNTFSGSWAISAVGDSGTLSGKRKTM
jgi:hypothetical protein